jgi:Fe-S oxidoreductase
LDRQISGPFDRMNITLFIPCFVDTCFPQVGMHMVRILERLGHRVTCPEAVACCGQPAFNSGYWDEARMVAGKTLHHLRDAEAVVSSTRDARKRRPPSDCRSAPGSSRTSWSTSSASPTWARVSRPR